MEKKRISFIIPVYNEEKNINLLYTEVIKLWKHKQLEDNYDLELVFINDGSKDTSQIELEKLSQKDTRVVVIEFSRNFGKEVALTAGLNNSTGDAGILFDCDLQYPLELVPDFIAKWQEGYDLVIGIRDKKKEKNVIYKLGSDLYYKLIKTIADREIVRGAIDFRLLDRIVIDEFKKLGERNRMTRALIDWLGFKKAYVKYQEKERQFGVAAYTFQKRVKLAINGVLSQSLFPLKFAGYLGTFITVISVILGVFVIVEKYILKDIFKWSISGSAILAIINLFLVGVILICLGLMALYIANIHVEVNERPLYIIRKKYN